MAKILPAESPAWIIDNNSKPRTPSLTGLLLHAWSLKLGYAKRLVTDIPDDRMALQPAPEMNHAA